VITAFNENLVDAAVSHIHKVPWIGPKLEAPFKELLVKQKEKLHRKVGTEASSVSSQYVRSQTISSVLASLKTKIWFHIIQIVFK